LQCIALRVAGCHAMISLVLSRSFRAQRWIDEKAGTLSMRELSLLVVNVHL
jgi:hypothetical protein